MFADRVVEETARGSCEKDCQWIVNRSGAKGHQLTALDIFKDNMMMIAAESEYYQRMRQGRMDCQRMNCCCEKEWVAWYEEEKKQSRDPEKF